VLDTAGANGMVGNFNFIRITRSGATQPTPFTGTPIAIPSTGSATIEAENFDNGGEGIAYHDTDAVNSGKAYRTTGVDIVATTDTGGGYLVGWAKAGEWLVYSVDLETAGNYDFDFRVASAVAGGKFHVEVDGTDVTGALAMPNTGGWQTWQTVKKTGIALTAGTHLLRLAMDAGATGGLGNFNYVKVTRRDASPTTILKSNTAAFVRDGSYAWTNYGGSTSLEVKKSTTGYNRETYVKFDLGSVATLGSAKLRFFGNLSDTALSSMTIGVYGAASTWTESGLTWSNRPAAAIAAQLASFGVAGTAAKWYEVDLTGYLKSEKAAGRNVVTLVLRSQTSSATVCTFASDEGVNGPELRVTA
jgi:hypothetical protein